MPDSKRFLHPEAIGRIARLEVRARHIVEGFLVRHAPQSVLRPVGRVPAAPRVRAAATTCATSTGKSGPSRTATTSSSSRKTRTCGRTLLVDVSGSMQYGSGPLNKYEYGCTIARQPGLSAAAAAGRGGLRGVRRGDPRQRAAAHQAQPSERDRRRRWPPASRREKTDLYAILRGAAETYPRRGVMVLISDLLVDRAGSVQGAASCCGSAGTTCWCFT